LLEDVGAAGDKDSVIGSPRDVLSMIRCWSSALTPFLFRPSLEQIDCRVLLSMPEFFTRRTKGSGSSWPPPIEAMPEGVKF
jgi:hypothetical protein